jgi:ABC-type multidrug transport system permease subunit
MMLRGYLYHLQLALRLNFASKQALVYGFAVPLFFVVAFGAVFRSGTPPLLHQMSQIVTIGILGGACFGMPTAMVAERERGLWRRFRLLPRATVPIVASTLTARFVLIAVAAAMQVALARLAYGTPLPQYPALFAAGYAFAAFAFLGLGLLVAALANDVPAVQALGQCVFLPLIMIGGVGVPLAALPAWAQAVAGFLPGRYSVDAIQAGYSGDDGRHSLFLNLAALLAIGAAAGLAGARLFRWDPGHRPSRNARIWIPFALLPWAAVGTFALASGRWRAPEVPADPAATISTELIDSIDYRGLPADESTVTPVAPPGGVDDPAGQARLAALAARLEAWPPGHDQDRTQAVRNLLCVATVADLNEDPLEGSIARTVFTYLFGHFKEQELTQSLAWIILHPNEGVVTSSFPELDLPGDMDQRIVRDRSILYAKKVLGRIRGRLPD